MPVFAIALLLLTALLHWAVSAGAKRCCNCQAAESFAQRASYGFSSELLFNFQPYARSLLALTIFSYSAITSVVISAARCTTVGPHSVLRAYVEIDCKSRFYTHTVMPTVRALTLF